MRTDNNGKLYDTDYTMLEYYRNKDKITTTITKSSTITITKDIKCIICGNKDKIRI